MRIELERGISLPTGLGAMIERPTKKRVMRIAASARSEKRRKLPRTTSTTAAPAARRRGSRCFEPPLLDI